jgi:hypothetical protein
MWEIRPQNSRCLHAWLSRASSSATDLCFLKPMQEIRPQKSCSPKAWLPHACITTALPFWSPHLESRSQNSSCPKAWFPCVCSSCHGYRWPSTASNLRALAACRLGSPMPAPSTMPLESQCLNASRPQGLSSLVGTTRFKPTGFAAPQVPSTCYTVPGACHHTPM